MADETGRREFEITTNPDRTLHSANDDARDIPREAAALVTTKPGDRRCTGKVKLRPDMRKPAGPDNEYFRNEDGSIKTRPCRNHPIKGGWVCEKHGGSIKVVRNRANKRLLAMAEPALIRLNELAHQSTHLPTALGAVEAILKRAGGNALGVPHATEADTRPVINIGIKVGGIDTPKPEIKVGILPATTPAIEGEVAHEDGGDS
jgi:hypothetical protein